MAFNPQVLALLEEMLDAGKTPEEACRDSPELLDEVMQRWQHYCLVDAQLGALLPGLQTVPDMRRLGAMPDTGRLPDIPGYEVEALLGHGGMGVVYKARQRALGRFVAIKMLLAGPFAGPQELERFRRETAALASLHHPNIVQVYDAGDVEGRPYFTMELIEGGCLTQKITGTPRQAAALLVCLAEAVHAAHQSGIVHRDLKPANILLNLDGTPKISDFGLARRLDGGAELTLSGVPMGTPSYMAPEQAQGHSREIGPAVDVHALGAILYEFLAGRPPFCGATPAETLRQVIHQDPVPPARLNSKVPRDLDTICLKCLQKNPGKRYATAADLAADLGRFLRHEPIQARPTGWFERCVRWGRRRPAFAILMASVVLLLLVGGAGAGLQYQQWTTARARQDRTDREVRGQLGKARTLLAEAWDAQDPLQLTAALAEGNRTVDVSRSGDASAAVRRDAETFQADADEKMKHARRNDALREAVLDVAALQERSASAFEETGRVAAPALPTPDEQYAEAFRHWGLDVDGTAEADVVAKLGAEPDVVVQELAAALDSWMLERRRLKRPEAGWRRLFRIAEQLDHSERHRWLRRLLIDESQPRATSVAGLVGTSLSWPALWQLACGDDQTLLRDLRMELDLQTAPVLTVVLLAQAYAALGNTPGAEQVLRDAVTARPDQVVLLDALGKLLESQGPARRGKAIEYYRAARAKRPRLGIALSAALINDGRADDAERIFRDLLYQQGESPPLYNFLGVSLDAQKKHQAAEAAYRKAIALAPDSADAYCNLGMCLVDQQQYEAAEQACRKAINLGPDWADSYFYLGYVLDQQRKRAAAADAYRKAIALRPDWADANFNLGYALIAQGKPGAAEAAFRKAIELRPEFAGAHSNLGTALGAQHKLSAAEAAFRRAIALEPNLAEAHNSLGSALAAQRKQMEAEAAFRKAIDLRPSFALPHVNLAYLVGEQGRFEEALALVKQGIALLPAAAPIREDALSLVQRYERCMELDARLPAVLRGAEKPVDPAEQIHFAQMCVLKKLYVAAAQFYEHAFTAEPKLGEDPSEGTRYNAACAAALACCARGSDTDALSDKERAHWRRQALEWLRKDLTLWSQALDKGNKEINIGARLWLQQCRIDYRLDGLRAGARVSGLPDDERKEWKQLWSDVDALIRRIAAPE
jgi:serine/threonine-protein kinase